MLVHGCHRRRLQVLLTGTACTLIVLCYFIHGKCANSKHLYSESSLNEVTELLGWRVIAKHDLLFFIVIILITKQGPCWNAPWVLDTVLTEALDLLSAVPIQVRLDGHEGHRMAGSEISPDRECKEGRRAYQWGTVSPTFLSDVGNLSVSF